ncbi:hypothetical protein D3C86_1968990 [compost metagenome]
MHRNSSNARLVSRDGGTVVWTATGDAGETYAALFNTGESEMEITVSLEQLNVKEPLPCKELWSASELGTIQEAITVAVPPHGARLYRLASTAK